MYFPNIKNWSKVKKLLKQLYESVIQKICEVTCNNDSTLELNQCNENISDKFWIKIQNIFYLIMI